jgi:hypothetical protein
VGGIETSQAGDEALRLRERAGLSEARESCGEGGALMGSSTR